MSNTLERCTRGLCTIWITVLVNTTVGIDANR